MQRPSGGNVGPAMRAASLICVGLLAAALPRSAAAEPAGARILPGAGCVAPLLLRAADLPRLDHTPPPLRLALLSCPHQGKGPRKRRLRWT